MATVLIIVGLVIMVLGIVVFLIPPKKEEPVAEGVIGDAAELLKQVALLLDKLDKRFRPGLILMLIGLALVGCGVFLESKDAKSAVEKPSAAAALVAERSAVS
jgi:uncharacterized membrane protein